MSAHFFSVNHFYSLVLSFIVAIHNCVTGIPSPYGSATLHTRPHVASSVERQRSQPLHLFCEQCTLRRSSRRSPRSGMSPKPFPRALLCLATRLPPCTSPCCCLPRAWRPGRWWRSSSSCTAASRDSRSTRRGDKRTRRRTDTGTSRRVSRPS